MPEQRRLLDAVGGVLSHSLRHEVCQQEGLHQAQATTTAAATGQIVRVSEAQLDGHGAGEVRDEELRVRERRGLLKRGEVLPTRLRPQVRRPAPHRGHREEEVQVAHDQRAARARRERGRRLGHLRRPEQHCRVALRRGRTKEQTEQEKEIQTTAAAAAAEGAIF